MKYDWLTFNKKALSVKSLYDKDNDLEFWLSKTPEERVLAVEFLRQLIYGYDPFTERLQRVFETAEFKTS
jgi:hypothetical protein